MPDWEEAEPLPNLALPRRSSRRRVTHLPHSTPSQVLLTSYRAAVMADDQDENSIRAKSQGLLSESKESLAERLRASEAKVQILEAQVRTLKEKLEEALRYSVSPQRPAPGLLSTQQPHEAFTFSFHIENPPIPSAQQHKNKSEKPSHEFHRLLKQLPKTEEDWCQRRKNVNLPNIEAVTKTFLGFITRVQLQTTASEIQIHAQSYESEGILRSYRQFVDSLRQDGVRAHQLSNFAILLFVCLCRVAREHGTCLEIVDELLDEFLPRATNKAKRQSGHLRHLRTAVLWPVLQAELLRKRFAHRADEYFLLYGPPINTYDRLWRNKGTHQFGKLVKLPPPPATGEVNADFPFSVPLMVKLIAGRLFSLEQINKALQTHMCREQFDAALSSICASTQRVLGIRCPLSKRQKISDSETFPEDSRNYIEFINIIQHGKETFSPKDSSVSTLDDTGRLPHGPDNPATNFDRYNGNPVEGLQPGSPTVGISGQEPWGLQPLTYSYSSGISTNPVEQLDISTYHTEFQTLQWDTSSPERLNGISRSGGSQSPFADVMRLQGRSGIREISQDLQHDGREDNPAKDDLFGTYVGDAELLFELEPSGSGF